MSGIYFNEKFVSYQEILNSTFSANHYFGQALSFCRDYLSGKSTFPVMTSGSTGTPKLINLSRSQLHSSATKTIKILGLKPAYKALVCISTDHIGGKMMLVRGMELGMDLYLIEPKTEINYKALPQIDFVALVPAQVMQIVLSTPGQNFLRNCQVTIIGGAWLDTILEKELVHYPNPIYHTFGMTETASHFAIRRINGLNRQHNYSVLPGVQMSVDDRGCLTLKGDITGNKQLITNDLISLIDKNTFKWMGRWDRVINTGGYKVHPELLQDRIQVLLESINIQAEQVVTDFPHAKWGQQVVLILETNPLQAKVESEFRSLLKTHLHPYEVPKQIKYLDSFPRTDSGKVDIPRLKMALTGS